MTAVEFLESKIFGDEIFSLSKVIEQAKEMEKQQIIDAYKAAEDQCEYFIEEHKWNRHYETAEPYYNNKYK